MLSKSKYPGKITDEESMLIFGKKVSSLEVRHFPRKCIWSGDREDAHFQLWNVYYWSLFDNFSYVSLISDAEDDTVN